MLAGPAALSMTAVIQEGAMGARTIRLDDEAERALEEVVGATGMTVSEALRRGLFALRDSVAMERAVSPYEIYASLAIDEGGRAAAPAGRAKEAVREAIRRKVRP